ncbi:MAG: regulator of protease activity HflC (stomatin/prohibitin superfamily) [Planctomycetota bacterium]|jgi:regulator of protease activity HflC (stomatin/prohibitin superfamily)
MNLKKTIPVAVFAVLALVLMFHWSINRIYVDRGQSLMLRYKGPLLFGSREKARVGHFAEEGQIGVLAQLRGPGRHFYCPIWWEVEIVEDMTVEPGYVALVRSSLGDDLPAGQYLVDGKLGETKFKGIMRTVFGPGRYRVNPYAYEFKKVSTVKSRSGGQIKLSGWVEIPTGYVGVVTNQADNLLTGAKKGIQSDVLPPGIYPINGKEQQVDVIEIGFREATVGVEKMRTPDGALILDKSGEPQVKDTSKGINFPSNDGFPIHMDFTAIWGIMPDAAPKIIRTFGNIGAVEDKVVLPQIESICRNNGSRYSAVELLVGEDRQKFQEQTTEAFRTVLNAKDITLQYGLVRHIYIPVQVREPIQNAFIADELKLTRDQEQLTAKVEGKLREAERKVELESEKVRAETDKLVAEAIAQGHKTVGETAAETEKFVAKIDRQVAELESQATVVRGQAGAESEKMLQEAKADKFGLAVKAFGSGEAYTRWVFASGLPKDIKLQLLYAGEGTFWTDLKGFTETMLGKQLNDRREEKRP